MESKSSQDVGETWEDVVKEDFEKKRPQVTTNVWKDEGVLYRLQHGEFLFDSSLQERHRINHCTTQFH